MEYHTSMLYAGFGRVIIRPEEQASDESSLSRVFISGKGDDEIVRGKLVVWGAFPRQCGGNYVPVPSNNDNWIYARAKDTTRFSVDGVSYLSLKIDDVLAESDI